MEAVNHPSHYNIGKYETIDFIEDLGLGVGFNLGNSIKYISRAGHKDGNSTAQDIKKALWYVKRQKAAWEKLDCDTKASLGGNVDCRDYIEDKQLGLRARFAIEAICIALREASVPAACLQLSWAMELLQSVLKEAGEAV